MRKFNISYHPRNAKLGSDFIVLDETRILCILVFGFLIAAN